MKAPRTPKIAPLAPTAGSSTRCTALTAEAMMPGGQAAVGEGHRAQGGGDDAGGEVDDREAARAEEDLVERPELVEGPGVRGPVEPAAVEEHRGDEAPVLMVVVE